VTDQSHWDKEPREPRQGEVQPAPELPDNTFKGIEEALESGAAMPQPEDDAAARREEEKALRKAQYEVDKWEAMQEDISVGELRERRHREAQGDTEPAGEVFEEAAPEVADEAQDDDPVVALLTVIAADLAEIKDSLAEGGQSHG